MGQIFWKTTALESNTVLDLQENVNTLEKIKNSVKFYFLKLVNRNHCRNCFKNNFPIGCP